MGLIDRNFVAANCLNACDTPLYGGGTLPTGTIFANCGVPYSGAVGTAAYPLYVVL